MNPKAIGAVALIVVAVGLLAFSFKKSFMNGPPQDDPKAAGAQMKAAMEAAAQRARTTGGTGNSSGRMAPTPTGRPDRPGRPMGQ